jgi:hypothetical protein
VLLSTSNNNRGNGRQTGWLALVLSRRPCWVSFVPFQNLEVGGVWVLDCGVVVLIAVFFSD